jgi:ferredoxin/flavodoxin---NADP+ reductase
MSEFLTSVVDIKNISKGNYIMRLNKKDLHFNAGQFFSIGLKNIGINREYSVASSPNESYIDFFIREIEDGSISSKLRKLKTGDEVKILGPFGEFYLNSYDETKKYIFIATGTGLAPFLSLINHHKIKNYEIHHGIRYLDDIFNLFELNNYNVYVSREEKKILASYESKNIHIFKGRMNNYLNEIKTSENNLFFLCGNSRMVSEVYDVLVSKEVSQKNIFTEIFF